ncbi:putative thiopurine S-methyltransferase [Gastrophryne carolinensis]
MSDHPEVIEHKQTKVLTDDDWKQKWEARNIGFHEKDVHPLLSEFLNEMVNGRENLRIFFPLCGKAVDMKWLADMGHTIVGVDVSETGLKEFFEEHNVPYVEEALPGLPSGKVFKSTSGNILLYCCSIYDISVPLVGKFDGVWDRGAMVAVNPIDRARYAELMLSLLNEDCRYFLVTVEYNPKLHAGPPFYVTNSDVEQLLGSVCNYKLLKKIDGLTEKQRQWGLDFYNEKIYLVTPKP